MCRSGVFGHWLRPPGQSHPADNWANIHHSPLICIFITPVKFRRRVFRFCRRAWVITIMTLDIVRLMLFPALMAFAAVSDLFTMTISNRISLLLVAGFVLLAVLGGMGLEAISLHLAAGFSVLVVAFVCFAFGWIGGGDAKLAAATALWFGFDHLVIYLAYASVAGGMLTLLILQFRNWPLPRPLLSLEWLRRLHDKDTGVPYGIALAIGALLIYPDTEWMKAIDLSRFIVG